MNGRSAIKKMKRKAVKNKVLKLRLWHTWLNLGGFV